MSAIYYELPDYGDDFLMHHGIKGMKWGIRRTAEQLGHFTKKVYRTTRDASKKAYQTSKKIRDDRIEKAKNNAITTGDYNKIKKYEKYMSDNDIKSAQARMQANIQLRDLQAQSAPNKRVQKKIDKAVRKGDFKSLLKLEKKMSDKDFKAAYERLDTRRKLKDMNDQSMVEKGIKVMETIGRVGKATLTIGQNVQGFRDLKQKKMEAKQKTAEAKNKLTDANDLNKKAYLDKVRGMANKEVERIMSDKDAGSLAARQKAAAKMMTEMMANASADYDRNNKIYKRYLKEKQKYK